MIIVIQIAGFHPQALAWEGLVCQGKKIPRCFSHRGRESLRNRLKLMLVVMFPMKRQVTGGQAEDQ